MAPARPMLLMAAFVLTVSQRANADDKLQKVTIAFNATSFNGSLIRLTHPASRLAPSPPERRTDGTRADTEAEFSRRLRVPRVYLR
jgi:hypothetical protein